MSVTVTNEHLRKEFDDFEKNEDFGNLLEELKYSTLIVPFDDEKQGCATLKLGGDLYIPLFTDIHEYQKVPLSDNYRPEFFEFNFYLEILHGDIKGFIINVDSERFPITKVFLELMETDYKFDLDYQPFTQKEIKRIYDSVDNSELEGYLKDDSNRWDFEGVMDLLFKSQLLTVVVSDEDLDVFQEDGVISKSAASLTFYRTRDNYAALFSSAEKIHLALKNRFLYSTLVNLGVFIDFALKNDLEGIMINDDVVISREFLMNYMKSFRWPCLDKYDDYIFLI